MENLVCKQCIHCQICKHKAEFDKVISANMEVNTDKSKFYSLYAYCKFFESSIPPAQNLNPGIYLANCSKMKNAGVGFSTQLQNSGATFFSSVGNCCCGTL